MAGRATRNDSSPHVAVYASRLTTLKRAEDMKMKNDADRALQQNAAGPAEGDVETAN